MLEFAQIEAGNYHLNLDTFELVSIFKNCILPHKKHAAEKHLNFTTNFTEEKIFVEIDLQCAENIINNLLDNAVKFTNQGYIEVELSVLLDRDLAICKVKDTGVGISTKYLEHLYQPFSQEDLDIGRAFEGNGLGLAIAKRYIEKMGGSLIVDSIKGVGSTFTFTLPLAKGPKADKLKTLTEKSNGMAKILMLDDAGESYDLVKAFLKDNFEINLKKYVEFHIDVLEKEKFIAVIFDVTKNHWEREIELCKELKLSLTSEIPVVILSSEFISERIDQFFEAGADEFLVKPFAKNDLIKIINRITTSTRKPS
jgi:CheY-like chemotaxis protein